MGIIEEALQKTTDTKALILEEGALERTAEMFKQLFGDSRAVVVADTNTYRVAGQQVVENLKKNGVPQEEPFVFTDPDLYAEWSYLEQLEDYVKKSDAIPVAVGSGVINDLTKLVSTHLGRKYMIVGTAASMDGYTAYGASITFEGNKQTFDCKAPYGALLDPAIAAKAPEGMSASGFADLIAKVPAGADWMLAEAVGAEKVDEFSFNLVQSKLRESLSDPDAVAAGEVQPTAMLAEGLIMSGFAMQALQSSRPASGMEHQFSHYWDMEGLCYQGKHVSHGFKVGIGTLVSTACLEYLLDYDLENLDVAAAVAQWPTWEEQERQIRTIFAGKPGHLARALKESKDKYADAQEVGRQLEALKAVWPELKVKIREQIYPYAVVYDKLKRMRAPYEPEMIGVSRAKLLDTFKGIPYMRSRFTSADILLRAGLLKDAEAKLFGKGGYWDCTQA
ncbi:MAG: sn-glycerol-1-phosphate dehydrogenase [Bacteroidaceae bacterium]|nr:sn-glycerol-1-phosphate dehydrogenase [Bacteroidaceae bacterium]